jgi:CubicO group peptidase (beta-lactamase class C family)
METLTIAGTCAPEFEAVRSEFERNFADRGEVGASVCVTVDGEVVVDLWGGVADPATGRRWERDSVAVVFSATKGATATCAHLLVSEGRLDLGKPVATYWPEFAQAGKADIPAWMLLTHQAGLPAVAARLAPGSAFEWDVMVDALAAQAPFWEPGTRHGYHALTFGWLVGEVVRRVSGRSLGTFFREEIADPLGLDFWIGLPQEHEPRVAPVLPDPSAAGGPGPAAPQAPAGSVQALVWQNNGMPENWFLSHNSREAHAAEIGAGGGITNGRGLAGLYRPLALGGGYGTTTLVDDVAGRGLARCMAAGIDAVLLMYSRFALGYYKTWPSQTILSEEAFGHLGAGGSAGFADPPSRMSFGYVMNQMDLGLSSGRTQSLVDAAYRSVGYRTRSGGSWVR